MILTRALQAGDCVRLLHFGNSSFAYRERLMRFGLLPGVEVKVVRRAPLGCPLEFLIRGTSLVLRERELGSVTWEPIA